ncbi:MAG TPA: lipopolysaccharide biosynthesis protein, partial [Terriglobales bacterium]|nr:lipopolysaccharide biosynthesis protein [Terriglobales bacterium]
MAASHRVLDKFSTEHLNADLRGRSVRGGLLTLSSQGAQFLMQSVATVVLARLLTPADFGLVAMVTAITGLGQAFADLGLSEATIQHPKITHEQVSTLFWLNVAIGLVLTSIAAALAPVLAWFYREPRLTEITVIVSFTFLIGGLRVQHDALLKRQMRFRALAIRDVMAYVVAVPLAIVLALRGAGYWALVALPLALNFIQMSLSWLMVRWIPGLPRRNSQVRSLIAFGGNVAASYLVMNVNSNADNVLIGWYWGATPLGFYSRAYNLLMLPIRQLSAPAASVAVPTFSRVQDDPGRLARYYLRAANLIMWIIAPVFGFLFVAAMPIVILALGDQWEAAAPVFQILAIFALGQMLVNLTVWLLVSCGESRRLLKLVLIMFPVVVGSYAIGLPFGIKGVALSGSLVLLAIFPWMLRYSYRGTELTLKRLGRAILCPISVALAGIGLSELILRLTAAKGIAAQLLLTLLGFAVTFAISTMTPAVRRELAALKEVLRQSRSGASPDLADNPILLPL